MLKFQGLLVRLRKLEGKLILDILMVITLITLNLDFKMKPVDT